uniref:Secreted protein n=1 Tax=Phakopsora pachyrhizi TaxID=170000 RepID=A0A0S1MKB2_PHAPC
MIASFKFLTISLILLVIDIECRHVIESRQATPGSASSTFKTGSQAAIDQANVAQNKGVLSKATDGSQIVVMTADINKFEQSFSTPRFLAPSC